MQRSNHEDSSECLTYPGIVEDAEHVFLACLYFNLQRDALETVIKQKVKPDNLVGMMLSLKGSWEVASTFAKEVLQVLRRAERQRTKNKRIGQRKEWLRIQHSKMENIQGRASVKSSPRDVIPNGGSAGAAEAEERDFLSRYGDSRVRINIQS